jgi:hypothetical protein
VPRARYRPAGARIDHKAYFRDAVHHRILLATIVVFALAAAPASAALPVVYNGLLGYAHSSPTASPPGANGW